jgi:hypothetical protein
MSTKHRLSNPFRRSALAAVETMSAGRYIRFQRTKQQVTQAELSALLGISASQLSRLERDVIPADKELELRLAAWMHRYRKPTMDRANDVAVHVLHAPTFI